MKYSPEYGVGFKWISKDGADHYESLPRKGYNKTIHLRVSSFVGTCALGAMHYYARVSVPRVYASCNGKGQFSGYLGGTAPKEIEDISLDAERRLSKVERDMNDEVIGKIGEKTYRFNSEKDAAIAGLKLVSESFEGDWLVDYEDIDGGNHRFPLSEIKVSEEFWSKCKEACKECFD